MRTHNKYVWVNETVGAALMRIFFFLNMYFRKMGCGLDTGATLIRVYTVVVFISAAILMHLHGLGQFFSTVFKYVITFPVANLVPGKT